MYVLKDHQSNFIWVIEDNAAAVEAIRLKQADPSFYFVAEATEEDLAWCRTNGII